MRLAEGDFVSSAAIFSFSEAIYKVFCTLTEEDRTHEATAPRFITVYGENMVLQKIDAHAPTRRLDPAKIIDG